MASGARCRPRACAWPQTLASMLLLQGAAGIEVVVSVPAMGKKCYGEQVAKQELLVVEFDVADQKKVSVSVLGPHATIFSDHDREKVKTAFTTSEAGPHWMCIRNENDTPAEVDMKVLVG